MSVVLGKRFVLFGSELLQSESGKSGVLARALPWKSILLDASTLLARDLTSATFKRGMPVKADRKRRAILWDMDGTLIDSEPLHLAVTTRLLNGEGLSTPVGFDHATVGRSIKACHDFLVAEAGLRLNLSDFVSMKNALYLREAHQLRTRAGALAAVHANVGFGIAQAVVSNSDRVIVDASLGAINSVLSAFVSVSRNDVFLGKPSPDPYLLAAELLKVDAADCIVVEDSPTGAEAGLAAGMTVIAWPERGFGRTAFPPEVLFIEYEPTGTELRKLLTRLL